MMLLGSNAVVIMSSVEGHRIEWMRVFDTRCNSIGKKCIFLYPKSSEHQTIINPEFDPSLIVCNEFDSRRDLVNFIDSIQIQNWFFCWDADNWIREIAFAKQRISSLLMRPYLSSMKMTSVFRLLVKYLFFGFQILIRRAPIYLLRIPLHESRYLTRYWVDDPNYDLNDFDLEAKNFVLNEPRELNKIIILIPGFISMRKNPVLAIDLCKALRKSFGDVIQLNFTGKVDIEVARILTDYKLDWILVKDEFLPRADYLKELRSSSLVLLMYENIGSSGVVIDSLKYGVPVLMFKNRYWKSLVVESNGLVIFGERSVDKLAAIVERVLISRNNVKDQWGIRPSVRIPSAFDKMILEIQNEV